jgi:undecaprenyl diphosphate synthase
MKQLADAMAPGDPDWLLVKQIDPMRLPRHIAIIMDGNGRWARQRNFARLFGHRAGVNAVRTTAEACAQMGIQTLTLYAFSVENWKRPRHEVEGLWRLLRYYLKRELPNLMKDRIRLMPIGRTDSLPAMVQEDLWQVMDATACNDGMRLNLALNYGGRAELVDAVNTMIGTARLDGTLDSLEVTEEAISSHLYTAGLDDPDLLIRTSGEMRVSNFLLWQIAYSELYVTETLWPDFNRTNLLEAVIEFQSRERRFGGVARASEAPLAETEILFEELEIPSV